MRTFLLTLMVFGLASNAHAFQEDPKADEVASLKQRIALLEAQLKAVTLERDALQQKLDNALDDAADPDHKKKDPVPLDRVWKGNLNFTHLGKSRTQNAECRVTARDGKKVTLLTTVEKGGIWEFDCEFIASEKFKIVAVRRVRAVDAVVNDPTLPPVGGVTGGGTADQTKLILNYVWRDAKDGPLSGRYSLTPKQ